MEVVIADEMDAKLHPKLFRYIIELFTNPETNRNGAQLLLTSHDITTMIPEVFRRDEIWFLMHCGESVPFFIHWYHLKSLMVQKQEMMKPMASVILKDTMVPTHILSKF